MRLARLNRRSVPCLIVFAVFLAWSDLRAQTTSWVATSTDDWFAATNWTNGVPNLSSTATIATGGMAQINGSTAQAADLTIGTPGFAGYYSSVDVIGGAPLELSSNLTVNAGGIIFGSANTNAVVTIDPGGTVLNHGQISGGGISFGGYNWYDQAPVALDFSGGGTLNNTGVIVGSAQTPNFVFGDGAVRVDGASGNITNAGVIGGANGISLLNNGTILNKTGATIYGSALNDNGFNSASGAGIFLAAGGSITNQAGATIQGLGQFSWGIHTVSPVPVYIDNAGTISGNVDGINVNSDSQITNEKGGSITSSMESAIAVTTGSNSVIRNSGTISSIATDGSPTIAMFYGGTIVNNATGVITSSDGNAISIGFQGNSGPTALSNYGTINGNVTLANQPNTVLLFTGGQTAI